MSTGTDIAPPAPTPDMRVVQMDVLPEFIRYFHSMARNGGYDKIIARRVAMFRPGEHDVYLFPSLDDVAYVAMVYREAPVEVEA
jgi:hypothetical protein